MLGGYAFSVSRPHRFGLVIEGLAAASSKDHDYLHSTLLNPGCKELFLDLIAAEGLVVCRNLRSDAPSYRKVRGKSSFGRLSQAEYYHHDGCATQIKPRVVEIRMPHQEVGRDIVTAVAPFAQVVRAMVQALPKRCIDDLEIATHWHAFAGSPVDYPACEHWDTIQGQVTRQVRRHLDAESARAYFRDVDALAGAYDSPWLMGESRLMLNASPDLRQTMQHRRAYQKPRHLCAPSGSLVKRWTAEEA